ncbi:hypothetical protein BDW71DRAFT_212414 [Aspergillus fruticulosus]
MDLDDQGQTGDSTSAQIFHAELSSRDRHVLLDVDEFVTKYELDDLRNDIRTGALLLNDSDHIESMERLPDVDFYKMLRQFPRLCTIGSSLWGIVELLSPQPATYGDLQGVNVFPDIATSQPLKGIYFIVGCWCAIPLLRYYGRRGAAYRAVGLKIAALLLVLCFPTLLPFTLACILSAAASGMVSCIVPIYLAEISPISTRGSILCAWQLYQRFGRLMGDLVINAESFVIPRFSILVIVFAILSSIGFGVCFWVSPESPYWYTYNGELRQAYNALNRFRDGNGVQASRDLYRIYSSSALDTRASSKRTTKAFLRALAITITLLFCGTVPDISLRLSMHFVTGFITNMLRGLPRDVSISVIVQVSAILIMATLATNPVERVGRRRWVLMCMVLTSLALFALLLGLAYDSLFRALYFMTPWTLFIPWCGLFLMGQLYAAEVASALGREAVMAATITVSALADAFAAFFAEQTPWLTRKYSLPLFLVVHIVCMILVCAVMIETRRCTLDEIRVALDVPIRNRIAYRIRIYTPYIVKRHFLRRRVELESFEQSQYGTGAIRLRDVHIDAP